MPKEIVNAITSKLKYRNTSVDVGKRNGKHEQSKMYENKTQSYICLHFSQQVTNNSCYNAPVLFLINTKKDSEFGERDASVAAENIMLEATDLDLGSVYIMGGAARLNDFNDLQQELGIDPAFQTTVIVAVGKSAVEPEKEDRSKRYQVTIY